MPEINLTIRSMTKGLRVRLDETTEPADSFRVMKNAKITDRGGIAKRDGISVVGDYDTSGDAVVGLFNFEKADGTEILVKQRGTDHQYLDTTWEEFEVGLTSSKVGYAPHVVNTDDEDYLYFASRENGYKRWRGWFDRLTSALSGGETEVPVSSVLKADVYYSDTASSVTTTTVDVSGTPWSTDLWKGFHVRITSGTKSGKVSPISGNDSNTLTFTTIAGLTGTPTFEVRQLAVPSSGNVLIGGTKTAYTGVANEDSLTVASAPAASEDDPVVLVQDDYPANPKGNALGVALTKIYVANIKSAVSNKGSGDEATSVSRAVYVSALGDGTDFTFSAPRSADEGDVVEFAYGGGRVLDVIEQENAIYAGTPNYIEKLTYSQDGNDLPVRDPLKPGIGLIGKFIKGKDDIYFFTPDGEFTSLGRVENKDITPQSLDIGLPIKRILNTRVNDNACGFEWKNRLHMAQKLNSNSTFNDRILVHNLNTKSFEGDWILPANCFTEWEGQPAFGQANGANILKMYEGTSDVWDGIRYAISTEVKSNWINVTPSGMADQSVMGLHVAGHIRGNSEFDVNLMADFSETPVISVNFKGSEKDFVYSANVIGSLGGVPLGEQPMCSIDEADADGNRRFRFTVWFPDIYCTHLSWGMVAAQKDEFVEINQIGFTVSADPLEVGPGLVKS